MQERQGDSGLSFVALSYCKRTVGYIWYLLCLGSSGDAYEVDLLAYWQGQLGRHHNYAILEAIPHYLT